MRTALSFTLDLEMDRDMGMVQWEDEWSVKGGEDGVIPAYLRFDPVIFPCESASSSKTSHSVAQPLLGGQ